MKQYWKYVKPYLSAFILAPILILSEVVGDVLQPKFMTLIVDNGVVKNDIRYIVTMGGIMVLTALVAMACGIGCMYFSSKAAMSFSAGVREDVFSTVQKFSFNNIDKFSTGSLVTRLTNDITQIQNLVMLGLRIALRAPGMLIGSIIMAVMINPQLAGIVALTIPVLAFALYIIIKNAYPRFQKMQVKMDDINSGIQENLTNVRVIKSFVRQNHEEEKFEKANTALMTATLKALRIAILTMPIMMLAMNITTIAVIWYGGNKVVAGTLTVAELIAFTTYITQILMSLMMLSMVILNGARAAASSKRILEVLNEDVDISDSKESINKDHKVTKGKIQFNNVSFKYSKESEDNILEDISFTVDPGQTVGIIGATGSAKSSLVQLIPRLYDVTYGEVLVDDVNVKDYTVQNLRNGVAMVLQKNILFSGTIMDNLKWGDENCSEEEVIEAAKSAQADDFIKGFTDGYNTDLGQGGINLSGGQRQRLCIARAMLKKPRILILDDSTSAVDTATESKIRLVLKTSLKNTTKLIIAQRITSVMDADKIIIIDEGKIVGIGTHDELIINSEEYQEIYYSQKEKEVAAE